MTTSLAHGDWTGPELAAFVRACGTVPAAPDVAALEDAAEDGWLMGLYEAAVHTPERAFMDYAASAPLGASLDWDVFDARLSAVDGRRAG